MQCHAPAAPAIPASISALHQHLPHQPCAPRAQRRPRCHLPRPPRGPRKQQAGRIGARNQQHQRKHRQQPARKRAHITAKRPRHQRQRSTPLRRRNRPCSRAPGTPVSPARASPPARFSRSPALLILPATISQYASRLVRRFSSSCVKRPSAVIGAQKSGAVPTSSPVNSGGATPTTVNAAPSSISVLPTTPASPPSFCFQNG